MTKSRRWIVGSLCLAVVILIAAGPRLRRWALAGVSSTPPSQAIGTAPAGAASTQPTATKRPPNAAERSTHLDDEIELCGLGKVAVDRNDSIAAYRALAGITQRTGELWVSALLNSDDYRARAAGLLLEGKIAGGDLTSHPMSEQTRDALVQLAAGAGDPAVYAIAEYACGAFTSPAPGACSQLGPREWARLDPDNAAPWLMLANEARQKGNVVAESDAFERAASARKVDWYNDSLFAFAEPEMPKDASPLETWYLATETLGVESAFRPPTRIAGKHCSAEAMQDGSVKEQCNVLAELLVTKGTTLIDLAMGELLGARVGWSTERLEALTRERDALMQAILQAAPNVANELWTCSGVERGNAFVRQRVQRGELGAARDALERSGETAAAMAQKRRDSLENATRDAFHPLLGTHSADPDR